jgi:hypothetical protein
LGEFSVDTWQSTDPANQRTNPEAELKPCPHRPMRAWLQAHGLLADVNGVTHLVCDWKFYLQGLHVWEKQRPMACHAWSVLLDMRYSEFRVLHPFFHGVKWRIRLGDRGANEGQEVTAAYKGMV